MSTILFVAGGIETVPAIERAREKGMFVVVSDGSPSAPGMAMADASFVADTYDVAETIGGVRRLGRHLDGVIAVGADVPRTVAGVAAACRLPGISEKAAFLASDKLAMKEALSEAGVPVPWFRFVPDVDALRGIAHFRGFPLVLKPVDSRGARGVLLLRSSGPDLAWAFETAAAQSPTGRVMVEQFIRGPQISSEALVVRGEAVTVGLADRNYARLAEFAPYVIEDGGQMPTEQPPEVCQAISSVMTRCARALGVTTGALKGDIVVSGGEPVVIEVAARLSGGYFCTHLIPLSTGVDFVGAALDQAVGLPVSADSLRPRRARGVAQRDLFPAPGVVSSVAVPDPVPAGVEMLEVRVGVGDSVAPVTGHPSRGGVVITAAESREEAVGLAEEVVAGVRIAT